jgi:low temperature requirement protein LtrA
MRQRRPSLLRSRDAADSGKVGMVELFFDLVFVFAVTQLSHTLVADLSLSGLLQVGMLLVGVWWVWIDTSWVTNWLDPERIPVRLALLAVMLAGSGCRSRSRRRSIRAGCCSRCRTPRCRSGARCSSCGPVRAEPVAMRRNFQRLLVWTLVFSACWIAGAMTTHDTRIAWWAIALVIESLAPIAYFWVPGLGRSSIEDWDVEGAHLAERCALFIIIALGESLLVTGMTFAAREWDRATSMASPTRCSARS